MRKRGFEIIKAYEKKDILLPQRKTAASAGYDLAAAATTLLLCGKVTLVPTGLKAYMQEDEYLGIHIRSGISLQNQLMLVNSQGIIDADYYNNAANEGHILLPVLNLGTADFLLEKNTRIAQGIFYKYLKIDADAASQKKARTGGFGSTGES